MALFSSNTARSRFLSCRSITSCQWALSCWWNMYIDSPSLWYVVNAMLQSLERDLWACRHAHQKWFYYLLPRKFTIRLLTFSWKCLIPTRDNSTSFGSPFMTLIWFAESDVVIGKAPAFFQKLNWAKQEATSFLASWGSMPTLPRSTLRP